MRYLFYFFLFLGSSKLMYGTLKPNTKEKIKSIEREKKLWETIKGKPVKNQVQLGMLTHHITTAEANFEHNWLHDYIAVFYKGFFAGTMLNSRYRRSYVLGVSRDFYEYDLGNQNRFALSYNLGGITGYDEKTLDIAKYTPVLPIFSINASHHYKRMGLVAGWSVFVVYLSTSFTF